MFGRFTIFLILISHPFFSQNRDSIKTYIIDEITVRSSLVLQPNSLIKIDAKEIEMSDVQTIADISVILPSVKIQKNSRGESYFYLRNSGNRQLQLMFDGIPVNSPWDGRFDLSLIPANAISQITINKGIPSVIYGANTLGGVINVTTLELINKTHSEFRSLAGENNFKDFSLLFASGNTNYSYLLSAKYYGTDGYTLPSEFNDEENPSKRRINSYSSGINFFGKLNKFYGTNSEIGFSFSLFSGSKGVPPEIGITKKRFWKYPEIKKFSTTIFGTHYRGENGTQFFTYSLNYTRFENLISQFTDNTYSQIDKKENGDDNSFYGRIIFTNIFNENSLVNFTLSGLSSEHFEKISEFNAEKIAVVTKNIYEQKIFSTGVEYQHIQNDWNFTFGGSYDVVITTLTGNNPKKNPLKDFGLNSAFVYAFSPYFYTRINLGRKTRFPSMREMYSEALGKFKINPNLKAETMTGLEFGFSYLFKNISIDGDFFLNYIKDGIVRLRLPEDEIYKYMRINKSEIRILGFENEIKFEFEKDFDTGINIAFFNSKGKNDDGEFSDTLEYKPGIIAGLFLNYKLKNLLFACETKYIGKEYGLEKYFELLPSYFLLNLRLSYFSQFSEHYKSEFIFRINNVFDKLYYTQIGLPEAGREFRLGFNIYYDKYEN